MNYHCAICLQHHEQILMLGCRHDPCIQCAAKHFIQESRVQADFQLAKTMENVYCCEVCFETTKLDQASIEEIKAYARLKTRGKGQLKDERRKCKSNSKINNIRNRKESRFELMLSKKTSEPKLCSTTSSQHLELLNFIKTEELKNSQGNEITGSKGFEKTVQKTPQKYHYSTKSFARYEQCDRHLDQVKTYYCFKCSKNICPECVIHGEHLGHEVENVRKASGRLRGYYNQFLLGAQKYNVLLSSFGKEINSAKETLTEWNNRQKRILQQRFKQLYQILHDKEQKLLNQINQNERKSLRKIQQEQQEYECLSLSLKQKRHNLKDIVGKDISNWNFQDLEIKKHEIQKISRKVSDLASQRDQYKKYDIVYLKCDIVEEAIDTIEDLVQSFRLNVRDKELEGTATFRTIC